MLSDKRGSRICDNSKPVKIRSTFQIKTHLYQSKSMVSLDPQQPQRPPEPPTSERRFPRIFPPSFSRQKSSENSKLHNNNPNPDLLQSNTIRIGKPQLGCRAIIKKHQRALTAEIASAATAR